MTSRDKRFIEKRKHDRESCNLETIYTCQGRINKDVVKNICGSGMFIETQNAFPLGQWLTLTFSHPQKGDPIKISGTIAWKCPQGIGVRFQKDLTEREVLLDDKKIQEESKHLKKSNLAKDEFNASFVYKIWKSRWKLGGKYFSRDRTYVDYGYRIGKAATQATLLLLCTASGFAGFLYLCRTIWALYIATPTGNVFLGKIVGNKQTILDVLDQNLITFSLEITISAFLVCLVLSAIFQFLFIARYLYFPRGILGKTIFWGFCMTAAVATYIQPRFDFNEWSTAFAVALIPTLCVFPSCFKFADDLVPDIGDLVQAVKMSSGKILRFMGQTINSSSDREEK